MTQTAVKPIEIRREATYTVMAKHPGANRARADKWNSPVHLGFMTLERTAATSFAKYCCEYSPMDMPMARPFVHPERARELCEIIDPAFEPRVVKSEWIVYNEGGKLRREKVKN